MPLLDGGIDSLSSQATDHPVGTSGQVLDRALEPRLSGGTLQLSIRCSSIHFRPRRSLPVSDDGISVATPFGPIGSGFLS